MRPGFKEAKASVRSALARGSEPVLLADLACDAERAEAGLRKSPLYAGLSDYAELLPDGWRAEWLNPSGSTWDGALLYAVHHSYGGALKKTGQVPGFFGAAVDIGNAA